MLIRQPPVNSMTIEEQSTLFSRIQFMLLAARKDRDQGKLRLGAEMINSPDFGLLSSGAQEDLMALYSAAMLAATGALIG